MKQVAAIPGCKMPGFQCACCVNQCRAGAWYMGKMIYVCDGQGPGAIGLLKHELTHHIQFCRKDPDVTCLDRMKREMEANLNQGKTFAEAFAGAVWSSCVTQRCKVSDITDALAKEMWNAFPPKP